MSDPNFSLAARAFDLMTLPERKRVLAQFATLRYPTIEERFVEAVWRELPVIPDGDLRRPRP
jgi:hypothetical protein